MDGSNLSWLWAALIGVAATLLGTFFGWLLSKPKNKKINVILNKPIHLSENRAWIEEDGAKKGQLMILGLYMDLVFYNPADNIKLMRNIRVVFFGNRKRELFKISIKDLENTTTFAGTIKIPLGIDSINIPPHAGELFKCKVDFYKEEISQKDIISKAYLAFDDEKNNTVYREIALPNLKEVNVYKDK